MEPGHTVDVNTIGTALNHGIFGNPPWRDEPVFSPQVVSLWITTSEDEDGPDLTEFLPLDMTGWAEVSPIISKDGEKLTPVKVQERSYSRPWEQSNIFPDLWRKPLDLNENGE